MGSPTGPFQAIDNITKHTVIHWLLLPIFLHVRELVSKGKPPWLDCIFDSEVTTLESAPALQC